MSTSRSSGPQPLVVAGLVVAGFLAIALLTQASTGPDEPVELGSTPATSVSCDWLEGAVPEPVLTTRRGVIEADIELDRAAILDSALVDFEPTSVWLRVEVDSGPFYGGWSIASARIAWRKARRSRRSPSTSMPSTVATRLHRRAR